MVRHTVSILLKGLLKRKKMFTDEAKFHVMGTVDCHNCRIGVQGLNTNSLDNTHQRDSPKINVWCGLMHNHIIGSFIFWPPWNPFIFFLFKTFKKLKILQKIWDIIHFWQRVVHSVKSVTQEMSQVWEEVYLRLDLCWANNGAHVSILKC